MLDPVGDSWSSDWTLRGRGRSWLTAWRSITEEDIGRKPSLKETRLASLDTAAMGKASLRESPSFRKDLASLDAGLLHNPAEGTFLLENETELEAHKIEDIPRSGSIKDTSLETRDDGAFVVNSSDHSSDTKHQNAFQRYRRKVQGLFFPPWRPFTNIDLESDQEHLFSEIDQEEGNLETITTPELLLENTNIHVLGLGPIGQYIAHSIASLPQAPPVTLLFHRPLAMQKWHDEGAAIRLVRDGELLVQSGFNIESAAAFRRTHPEQVFPRFGRDLEHSAEAPDSVIDTLIVTVDSWNLRGSLEAIRHRLWRKSVIYFVHGGMGITDRVDKDIFVDPYRRPTYMLGRMSHKIAASERNFTIIEMTDGNLTCSKMPTLELHEVENQTIVVNSWSPQAKHLIRSLTRAPALQTQILGQGPFMKRQLQDLVLGCIIGPLSVMYNCSNARLLYNYDISTTMKRLLSEISLVILSLPELQDVSGIEYSFNAQRLEAMCVSAIKKTGEGISTQLRAVRAGKRTSIDLYNKYIVERGAELGIRCPHNEMMIDMVKAKARMNAMKANGYIPLLARG